MAKAVKIGTDEVDAPPNNYTFMIRDAIMLIMGLVTYLLDSGLDSFTAYKHWHHGDRHWSYMTIAFVLVPSILISIVSFWWCYLDETKPDKVKSTSKLKWSIRIILIVLQLAPVLRYIDSVILGLRSRKRAKSGDHAGQQRLYMEMLNEEADCCFLRLFESFLESIPQLVLQLYILCLVRSYEYSSNMIYVLWLSCLSSLISIAWGMTAYSRGSRYISEEKRNITWAGSFNLLLWQFGTIGSRIVIFVTFSLIFSEWIFAFFVAHWLIMFLWLVIRATSYKKLISYDIFLFAILALMYIFSFINDKDEKTRYKYIFYYFICGLENLLMVILCVSYSDPTMWFLKSGIIGHYVFFIVGLVAMTGYYSWLHPNFDIALRSSPSEEGSISCGSIPR